MNYLREQSRRETPQSEAYRPDQEKNPAGGFAWKVGDFTKLRRFLILGAEGGTYYVGQRELVSKHADALDRCLAADGLRTVELIRKVSDQGLAKDNDPALFALAAATAAKDVAVRQAAWAALPKVARTGTHLLHFVAFREQFGGWGRAAKRGVGHWYTERSPRSLAYQLVKYRQRDGWSHRDVLRLVHAKAPTQQHQALFNFVTGNPSRRPELWDGELRMVEGFQKAQEAVTPADSSRLIEEYGLPREAIKSDHLASAEVLETLLVDMPLTAMIRNLGNLTRAGVVSPMSEGSRRVVEALGDEERLKKARVHPLAVLGALSIYKSGQGFRSRGEGWTPVPQVSDALDAAFYAAFKTVEPANKRTLLAIDVSGSMGFGAISGVPGMSPRVGAAAMSLVTAASEPSYAVMAFAHQFVELSISPRQRIDDVMAITTGLPFGRTDCALPMTWAENAGVEVDTFVIYTDSETWSGGIHPAQALQRYREKTGIPARLVVVAMEASEFSIADPDDSGMLDVVGFDASAPAMISAFSRGEV